MISNSILQSIIKKYHLGEIEQVKWEIEDNKLEINLGDMQCSGRVRRVAFVLASRALSNIFKHWAFNHARSSQNLN